MPDAFAPGRAHLSGAPLFAGAAFLDAEKLDVYRTPRSARPGCGRRLPADKGRFYSMARGSATECAAILDLLRARGLVDERARNRARALLVRVVQMLTQLVREWQPPVSRRGNDSVVIAIAKPGTIAVLHTWTQTLAFHPHVHCIVTGGGLAPSGDRWIASRPGFLVPVCVLSRVFRGKLFDRFDRTLQTRTSGVGPCLGRRLLRQAASKQRVVYSKAPLAGPAQVLRYLSRYTRRIAIGNERLVTLEGGRVTFRYRDRKRGDTKRLLTLEAPDFVQRFLLHVLPRGFVRVRHFGLQANGCRSRLIPRVRQLLHAPAPPQTDNTHRESSPRPRVLARSRNPLAYNPHVRAQPRFSPTRCFRRRASITAQPRSPLMRLRKQP